MTTPVTLLAAGLSAHGQDGLALERKSQAVTDWAARIGWVVGLLFVVALLYWLMREGWKWRGMLQSGLPEPLEPPRPPAAPREPLLTASGRYHGSTTAGQWLDRIVAHGLGTRSRAELTLTAEGLVVVRPGARDFFVPAGALRGARLDKGIAGKVLTEGGLLVVTWQLGDTLIDSGFRTDRVAEHPDWVAALDRLTTTDGLADGPTGGPTGGTAGAAATPHHTEHDQEGASS